MTSAATTSEEVAEDPAALLGVDVRGAVGDGHTVEREAGERQSVEHAIAQARRVADRVGEVGVRDDRQEVVEVAEAEGRGVVTVDPAKRLADALGVGEIRNEATRVPDSAFAEVGVPAILVNEGLRWTHHTPEEALARTELAEGEDLDPGAREPMIINLGPQHPSTHGVFRIVAELDGEKLKTYGLSREDVNEYIETAMLRESARSEGMYMDDFKRAVLAKIPLRRLGKPEDVGNLAAFLASDESGYISGQTIKISGGVPHA